MDQSFGYSILLGLVPTFTLLMLNAWGGVGRLNVPNKRSSFIAANEADCAPFSMGSGCAMAANSSLFGSVCGLLPVWVAIHD